jgi:hypothetical protein
MIPAFFFAFIDNAKVLKKLYDRVEDFPFDGYILLPAFNRVRDSPNSK